SVGMCAVLRGQGGEAKGWRHKVEHGLPSDGFQHADFGCKVQTVAALRLDRGRTIFEKPFGKLHVEFRSFASCFHAREDATAARKDFHVRGTLNPPLKFSGPCASKYSVGMRIHESRQNDFTRGIEFP